MPAASTETEPAQAAAEPPPGAEPPPPAETTAPGASSTTSAPPTAAASTTPRVPAQPAQPATAPPAPSATGATRLPRAGSGPVTSAGGEGGPPAGTAGEGHRRLSPPDPKTFFERLDANKDGVLTADELPEHFGERIMRADANGDGKISLEEMQQVHENMPRPEGRRGGTGGPEGMFERFDADGNGLLSGVEIPERMREWMMRADANGDGSLSKEELEKARRERGHRRGPRDEER